MSSAGSSALDRHRIPAIDRMMDVLALLERRPNGATIREMVEALKLPRTTVYRILNTLQQHEMVRRSDDGNLRLGPRLLTLAARALGNAEEYDLASLSMPHLQRLSEQTGEGSKVSVLDNDGILVVAAVQGTRDYALTVVPGQRLPLHAGAASKVLLAHLPKSQLQALLSEPLVAYTSRTIRDPHRLSAELARIRRQGYAHDKGEYAPSINAFAAPIPDRSGKVIAALSVPYLAGADKAHVEKVRVSVIAVAGAIAADLPGRPQPRKPG
jgi:DNA-binding IclR family transcriptional regulator